MPYIKKVDGTENSFYLSQLHFHWGENVSEGNFDVFFKLFQ
jgi:hypothetical protein